MNNPFPIGLAQLNPTVGDLTGNAALIQAACERLHAQGARWVVLSELSLCGYPPEDLILKPHFLAACRDQLTRLATALPPELLVFCGFPETVTDPHGRPPARNSVALLQHGSIQHVTHKTLLPNYEVFDEKRLFVPASSEREPLVIDGIRTEIHVCEDSWFPGASDPQPGESNQPELLLNLSASPYHRGKWKQREAILQQTARRFGCPLLYVNQVGGQDELVFDGGSKLLDADGTLLYRAPLFAAHETVVAVEPSSRPAPETPSPAPVVLHTPPANHPPPPLPDVPPPHEPLAEVYQALCLGLGDYVRKNGFRGVLIAISGGIDSALAASLAVDALGPDAVQGFTMPSQYSSDDTLNDSLILARDMGFPIETLPIRGLYDAFMQTLQPVWDDAEPGLAEENLQARIRGTLIMTLSNKRGHMVVSTGNKSELATGYCTLYGDMNGGFAVIKDVPKTLVFELCRWRNAQQSAPWIPVSTIERPPSAELRPNQKDTDSLPPYDILDGILERYVELDQGAQEIIAAGFDPEVVQRVVRLVDRSEYKRRQSPPGVRITPKAFGRDRRVPITQQFHFSTSDPEISA